MGANGPHRRALAERRAAEHTALVRPLRLNLRRALELRRRRDGESSPVDGTPRLVITGAAGLIGSLLTSELRGDYEVRGMDARQADRVDWVGDLRRLPSIQAAFFGSEAVVHLGAVASVDASWPAVLDHNVRGTVNVLEAARHAGVARVILASSNHVVGGFEADEPFRSIVVGSYDGLDPNTVRRLGVDAPLRPDGPYGVSKAFLEAAGRFYSDEYGMSVLCLRIGTVNREDRPLAPRHFATWMSQRDLVELVRRSLAAPPTVRFGIVYGVSANRWRIWDLEIARSLLGFVPGDDAETLRDGVG